MYGKFSTADSKGNSNNGSCSNLANYLDKEEKDQWINHEKEDIKTEEVVKEIDRYGRGQLKKKQWKYIEVMYSPTEKEQQHLIKEVTGKSNVTDWKMLTEKEQKDTKKEFIKFVKNAQSTQARLYNREKIEHAGSLKWYAKIETKRTFKGTDEAVKSGYFKSGETKKGLNLHAHIIQSRKAMDKKTVLSPKTNYKNSSTNNKIKQGFDRSAFTQKIEETFDKTYGYKRDLNERFLYKYAQKTNNIEQQKELEFLHDPNAKLRREKGLNLHKKAVERFKKNLLESAKIQKEEQQQSDKKQNKNKGRGI